MREEPKMLTTEEAGAKAADMWRQIADCLQEAAISYAGSGDWRRSIENGRAAAWATWQATGEGDWFTFKDMIPTPTPPQDDAS